MSGHLTPTNMADWMSQMNRRMATAERHRHSGGGDGTGGEQGPPGPPGPTVVSTDVGNIAELGSDLFIYVPDQLGTATAAEWFRVGVDHDQNYPVNQDGLNKVPLNTKADPYNQIDGQWRFVAPRDGPVMFAAGTHIQPFSTEAARSANIHGAIIDRDAGVADYMVIRGTQFVNLAQGWTQGGGIETVLAGIVWVYEGHRYEFMCYAQAPNVTKTFATTVENNYFSGAYVDRSGPRGRQGIPGPAGPEGPAGDLPPGGAGGTALTKNSATDGDVRWGGDLNTGSIFPASGEIIQFPNEADRAKINLYSTTFGLGITSGTLNIFASSTVRFNKDSINGETWGYVDTNGIHVVGTHFQADTDGMGLRMVGDAHIYKQIGGGLVLRRAANTAEVIIEDSAGGNRRNIATKPDSEATVAHNATNFNAPRAGQNYILYNDSIVCWYVSITPRVLWEGSWQEVIPPNGYPDFLRPSRLIERWIAGAHSTGNATAVALGLQIETSGKVSCWKPADGPDIETSCVINIDFVYPRNY